MPHGVSRNSVVVVSAVQGRRSFHPTDEDLTSPQQAEIACRGPRLSVGTPGLGVATA